MAVSVRLFCGLFIGVLTLSACGGGGGSLAAPPTAASHGQPGAAALAVFVPSASTGSARRREQLPSSTQSIEIVVANESTGTQLAPVIVNISPTTSGCSSVSGGINCTIDVNVPFATLLFSVIGYTGQNATGNPVAWGDTVATISAGGSNAVAITTSSVVSYVAIDLGGNASVAVVDHSANTLTVNNLADNKTTSGNITYLPNGDEKFVVTTSTESATPVGSVVYIRELVGTAITFMSTGSSSPPATAVIPPGTNVDWGVGTALTPCPTAAASYEASLATIEGPNYQVAPNLGTVEAYQNGTASVSISGGNATLGFNGASYTISGAQYQTDNGSTGVCSGGIFGANTGSNGSGDVAFDANGVVVGANKNSGQTTSNSDGFAGFTVQSGSTPSISALTSATYDGFLGGYNVGSSITQASVAINVAPGGSNSLLGCNYSNFEAGTVNSSSCATIAFSSQPQPGIVLGTVTQNGQSAPAVFAVGQVSGKYVVFGVIGSGNVALIQH